MWKGTERLTSRSLASTAEPRSQSAQQGVTGPIFGSASLGEKEKRCHPWWFSLTTVAEPLGQWFRRGLGLVVMLLHVWMVTQPYELRMSSTARALDVAMVENRIALRFWPPG